MATRPVLRAVVTPKQPVIRAKDVASFVPTDGEGKFESRLLVDGQSVGSQNLVVNHFTLKPGQKTYCGHHPSPFEEVYYILRGRGILTLGTKAKRHYRVEPDTVAYIAPMEDHQIENIGLEDLEMLTIMPRHPVPGVNSVYDERVVRWGTSFKLKPQRRRSVRAKEQQVS